MATDREFIQLARDRWQQGVEATDKQRDREKEDLGYYAGDQWPDAIRRAREGQGAQGGLPPIPAQPTLTINKCREPVRQVLNQERESDLGITLVPADDFGAQANSEEVEAEIELREGLARRIQRASEAADARSWAFMRAVIAGTGYYAVMTRFLPGKTWDQEVYIHRFYNQASVVLDPAHEQPDGSDAEWGFIGVDMPWERYKAEFPRAAGGKKNKIVGASDEEFKGLDDDWRAPGDEAPGWFTTEGKVRTCRVVDYFYTERDMKTLALLPNGDVVWADELESGAVIQDTREVIHKTIKWAKLDGSQKLDETDWAGPDLPIVKVLGEELQPYDNERRSEGMIRPMRDPGQGYNAMISKLVGDIGYAPIPPFQATPDQIAGFEEWYKLANTRALPYLPYNHESDQSGKSLGPPTRTNIDTPIMAVTAAIAMFNDALQSTSGVHDPSLGKVDPSLKSGRALLALQQQSQMGTSNFLDNLQRSMRYEGQIINNLLEPIYGRAGRLVRIVTGTGENKTITISPAPGQEQPVQSVNNGEKSYRLTKDVNFNVVIKVTKAFASRREEEANILANLLESNPLLLTWFGDLFFKHQDGPGHQEMAERAKVMLDPKIQAMLAQEKEGGPQLPPEAQAQIQALNGQVEAAEAAMAELKQALDTKQVEQDGKVKIAALQADKDVEIHRMDNATKIEIAKLNMMVKGLVAQNEAELEAIALAKSSEEAERDRQQADMTQQADQQHEAEMQAGQQSHETEMGEQSHAQALEANQQQADLAPEPTGDA